MSRARCLNKDLRSRRDSCVSTRRSYRDVDFFLPFFLFSLNIGSPSPWPLGMIFVFHRRFNGCERRVDVGGAARRRIHRSAFLDLRQPIINRQPYLPRYRPHLLSLVPWRRDTSRKQSGSLVKVRLPHSMDHRYGRLVIRDRIYDLSWSVTRVRERESGIGKDFEVFFNFIYNHVMD